MEPIRNWFLSLNWADYIVLFGLIRGAYAGYRAGLLRELLRLFLYLVTLTILVSCADVLSDYVRQNTLLGKGTAQTLAITVTALVTYLVLKIAADLILNLAELNENVPLKLAGLIVGVFRWSIILSLGFYLINYFDVSGLTGDVQDASMYAYRLMSIAPTIIEFMLDTIPQVG